ncbi:MAG: ribosome small subunit-dependent GTPase A [Chloroflexota bacterium]
MLESFGWDEHFAREMEAPLAPDEALGRVCRQGRLSYQVITEHGELTAAVAGSLRHAADSSLALPAVGDWVVVRLPRGGPALIRRIVPRRSQFVRRAAGTAAVAQVVAANVDTVFIVMGLVGDFSLRRLERYLTLAWESGARPVVVLTKADLCADVASALAEASAVALGVQVHAVSTVSGTWLAELAAYLLPGQTIAFLGSSGVGKSTLINHFLGRALQKVNEVRESDAKGRHTTTQRQLLQLPGGALVIDTPGMRELQLWEADEGLGETFPDVQQLAGQCRFSDCQHDSEPGCAVREALADGRLDQARFDSYQLLRGELAHLATQLDRRAQLEAKAGDKRLTRVIRAYNKEFRR